MKKTIKLIMSLAILLVLISCTSTESPEKIPEIDLFIDLKNQNTTDKPLKAQLIADRKLWVYQPISNGKYVGHYFEKNANDDFILYSSSVIGSFIEDNFIVEQYVMAGSNKEFAYFAKPKNSTGEFKWFPEHENIGTAFAVEQIITFDTIDQDFSIPGTIKEVESVSISQSLELIYPDSKEIVAELDIKTTISSAGVSYTGNGSWKKDMIIEKGYNAMLPTITPLMETFITSKNNNYELKLEDSVTEITDNPSDSSYAFTSKNSTAIPYNIMLAQSFSNSESTLRLSEEDTRSPNIIWLEHRNNGTVQKMYPQVYENHITSIEEPIAFSANIFTGIITDDSNK